MDWRTYAATHLSSKTHERAVERDAVRKKQIADTQRTQEADLARQHAAELQFLTLRESTVETELWDGINADPYGAGFDVGQKSPQHGTLPDLWNAETMGTNTRFALDMDGGPTAIDKDDIEEFLAEIMQNAAISDPQIDDILNFESTDNEQKSAEWSPYPSKMLFLLDTLDNLPRLRISNSLMKVFLWILKESGAHNVPSFDHLRKVQQSLCKKCGVPTTQNKSAKGNIFHMNDPRTLIAKDWANPETQKFIRVYPEIPEDGIIREIWHAQKWRKDMDLDNLSPMYAGQYCHFYVNELAHLKTGELVIPIRWVKFKNTVCADAFKVEINSEGLATVLDETTILISASELTSNLLDLEDENAVPQWTDNTTAKGYPNRMPNPKRALAEGDQIYSSFVDYFGDDCLRKSIQQEFHVHFISTSPNASVMEQFTAFKTVIENTHKDPIKVHDDETHETTRLCIYGNAGPSDNPMQSKITGHIGAKGNHMCRKCKAGGTEKDKETDTCFHSLFEGYPVRKRKFWPNSKNRSSLPVRE
ncbi:hypothetical protein B0H14DRAFT_2620035 [Mycena olivaceomarginata]|nr:hypothetical protein B0H14DRAFT_2620035 [Mycena olivaceomarginata]